MDTNLGDVRGLLARVVETNQDPDGLCWDTLCEIKRQDGRIHQLEKTLSTMERELKDKTELLFRLEQNQKPTQANPAAIFLREVADELERGRKLFPGDQIKGLALAEEFGELIKALLDEPGKAVWKEAVQTAAMAARVAIDGDGSVDEWRKSRGLDEHRLGGLRRV